ncbi:hypothetical protein K502DRAFT_346761 [Neoconidiobolus thromboides FSU 785]|nr:hypothetical protein K502DRAFT_346761 [Neoconidiobolus thromboides FSU 785]
MQEIKILIAGEDGVGKSTLIMSLIKDQFVNSVQEILPEVTIPPEITLENITAHIKDSSSKMEYRDQIINDLKKSDVLCLIYSCIDRDSFLKIPDYWLTLVKSLNLKIPIIIIGNKEDLKIESNSPISFEEEVLPLMNLYQEIEGCMECSSKELINHSEVFYLAQKAVLYPSNPLYDYNEKTLTKPCYNAFKRIFSLIDLDKDDILNDYELNEFQKKCFDAPLSETELQSIKQVIRENEMNGIHEEGFTLFGFLFLIGIFIKNGRLETVWTILKKFHYNLDLNLDENYVRPYFEVPSNCTVELSPSGYQFFTEIFKAYDKDNDGALNEHELNDLFELCPKTVKFPWDKSDFPDNVVTNQSNAVTLQGFLAMWSLTTLQDHQTTLSYLAYLGFDENPLNGIRLVAPNHLLSQYKNYKVFKRNVFFGYVLGGHGSGKTSLLKAFVKKEFNPAYKATVKPFTVINPVDLLGVEKYLVLEEVGANYEAAILQNIRKLEQCDLLCLVYDSADPNSFLTILHLREQYQLDHIPYVIVATKSDLETVRQRIDDQPEEYCKKNEIAMPVKISVKNGDLDRLFNLFASVAMNR